MVERFRPKNEPEVEVAGVFKNKGGRPSSFNESFIPIAEKMCSLGATDADLADAFGVSTVTIQNWQSKYPEFKTAIALGKAEVFDPKVERALAQLALGYSVDIEEVKITKDGDEIRYDIRKHYPPNVTACIFWLKNRKPEMWRDTYDHNHTSSDAEKPSEQLLAEIRAEAEELGLLKNTAAGVAPPTGLNGKTKH